MRPDEIADPRMEENRQPATQPPPERRMGDGDARWQDIKSRFVDDPAGALEAAEQLVRMAFEDRVRKMQAELEELRRRAPDGDGDSARSTEEMRTRLIRYQAYHESLSGVTAH